MDTPKSPFVMQLQRHLRSRLLSGLFVLVPIGVTIFIMQILFGFMAMFTAPFLHYFMKNVSPALIQLISIVLFVILIYIVGLITTYVVGRRAVSIGESLLLRIPLVKNIYGAAKQVVDTFSQSKGTAFSGVVMIEYPRVGLKSLGFATGSVTAPDGSTQCLVFVPTAPNPTSGFMVIVPETCVEHTAISIEDGFKMVVSGGMIIPDDLGKSSAPCTRISPPGG